MKKTFLLLTMTLLFFIGSGAFNDTKAQDVVTIGNVKSTITKDFSPSYNYQQTYSVSQQIYLKDEIGKGGTITHIAFQINLNETANRNIVVYMKETDSDECNTNQFEKVEDNDIVFSGNHLFKVDNEKNHEWNTIKLSTEFEYSGDKNICIIVNDITGAKGSTGNSFYYSVTSDEQCRAMYANSNKNQYDASLFGTPYAIGETLAGGYRGTAIVDDNKNIINNIQFTFESEGEGGETPEPETPELDLTKYYRIKSASQNKYLHIMGYNGSHASNTHGDVGLSEFVDNDEDQIFKIESTRAGSYNFVSANGYSIVCSANGYNVDAYNNVTASSIGIEFIEETQFYLLNGTKYFKVGADSNGAGYYPYCDADLSIAETWSLEEATVPITLTANLSEVTVGENITFTVLQGVTDVTSDSKFYINDEEITNPYTTTTAGTFTVRAEKDGLEATTSITVNEAVDPDPEEPEQPTDPEVPATPGNGETVFTPYGAVTYNKGMENEYTLLVDMTTYGGDAAVIMEDNVNFSWGDATNCGYVQDNTNKPNAETSLTIPAYVLNGTTKWIPVTEIADYAFDSWTQSLTDLPENEIEPGNERNDLFTSLVIPNTVTNIGQFAFSCELEGPIFCYASTPPTCEVPNNIYYPFLTNTYNNAILYVPAGSIDAYKTAAGWSRFKTIAPLTISTFENKVDDDWANADNWKKYIEKEDGTYTETWGSLPNAGEDVLINGDAVIPAGYTANVGAINIVSGGITVKDGAQLVHTNAGVAVTVEKEIEGYDTREVASTAWHTISSPIAVMTPTNNVNGLLNGAYDLYYYDEPTHYWINHEQETNEFKTLDAGRGYLYANENDVTLKFNGVINYDNVSFKLDATSEYEGLRGFNLIGNPFTHNIHLGANIYSENLNIEGYYSLSKEGQWGAKKASSSAIAPCQGILVQTSKEETINIVKSAAAPATRSAQPALNITVANEQYDDNAYVLFKEGQGLNKINHMNENIPMVYVISDNEKFAIANVNDNEEIALGFEAMTMGEYTIAVKAQDCKFNNMILTDNITGEKTNLMTDSYTFMATTTDNPDRFTLTLNDDNDNDSDNDFIYINNNEMIINNIEGDGLVQIYDMMGRSVATYNVSGSANISMETLSNGVYVVRMTDNNGVKTQKVVNN